MNKKPDKRLHEEIRLLYKAEADHKIPATPVIRQLTEEAGRPLPDVLPVAPKMVKFQWPNSDEVDFRWYWQELDNQQGLRRRRLSPPIVANA